VSRDFAATRMHGLDVEPQTPISQDGFYVRAS